MSDIEGSPEVSRWGALGSQIICDLEERVRSEAECPYAEMIMDCHILYPSLSLVAQVDPEGLYSLNFFVKRAPSRQERFEFLRDEKGDFTFHKISTFQDCNGQQDEVITDRCKDNIEVVIQLFIDTWSDDQKVCVLESNASIYDSKRYSIARKLRAYMATTRSQYGIIHELVDGTIEP